MIGKRSRRAPRPIAFPGPDLHSTGRVPSGPVAAGLRKLLPDDPRALIENYDEVARAIEARDLARLLPA